MHRFCISLIISTFFTATAFAQNPGLDSPKVEMDAPSVEMDMGDGMGQDSDRMLMEKNINDLKRAQSELAAMSEWGAPGNASKKEREEWQEQSRRLQQHAMTLKDLSSNLNSAVEGKGDVEQAKSEARSVISSLHSDLTTRNLDGEAAAKRQRAAANTLDSVSLL